MSSTLVVVVDIAPVIMTAAHLCTVAILLMGIWLLLYCIDFFYRFFCGVRNKSAPYKILGTAMERYSHQMYFADTPLDTCASLPNWTIQSCPFARAAVYCPFQVSLLSTIRPRNLSMSTDFILCCHSLRFGHGTWTHCLCRNWCGAILCVKSSSWNLSILNSQL